MKPASLLRHRDFRRLWTAAAISRAGTAVTGVATLLAAALDAPATGR